MGLPILDEFRTGLDKFFVENVIGGRGAFSVPANGFKDVFFAIRRKLILEISGMPIKTNGGSRASKIVSETCCAMMSIGSLLDGSIVVTG